MIIMIPKNIFFYWDKDIPIEVTNNIAYYKENNLNYNVILLNDTDINKYKYYFPLLIKLYHLVTIPTLKSDIIRYIFLHMEGGMWIDSNTTLVNKNGIDILFERYKNFDFVITVCPYCNNDLKASALISKPKSKLTYDILYKITISLKQHYNIEIQTDKYINYNLFMFIPPVVFSQLLNYSYDNSFDTIKIVDNDNNILTINSEYFKNYNCGLMDVKNILMFYGCNMTHHHGPNMHKHWSNLQKTQKLFINEL